MYEERLLTHIESSTVGTSFAFWYTILIYNQRTCIFNILIYAQVKNLSVNANIAQIILDTFAESVKKEE